METKKTKVWGIKENDFFKLIKKLNEFNRGKKVFATQIFQTEQYWYSAVYYQEE